MKTSASAQNFQVINPYKKKEQNQSDIFTYEANNYNNTNDIFSNRLLSKQDSASLLPINKMIYNNIFNESQSYLSNQTSISSKINVNHSPNKSTTTQIENPEITTTVIYVNPLGLKNPKKFNYNQQFYSQNLNYISPSHANKNGNNLNLTRNQSANSIAPNLNRINIFDNLKNDLKILDEKPKNEHISPSFEITSPKREKNIFSDMNVKQKLLTPNTNKNKNKLLHSYNFNHNYNFDYSNSDTKINNINNSIKFFSKSNKFDTMLNLSVNNNVIKSNTNIKQNNADIFSLNNIINNDSNFSLEKKVINHNLSNIYQNNKINHNLNDINFYNNNDSKIKSSENKDNYNNIKIETSQVINCNNNNNIYDYKNKSSYENYNYNNYNNLINNYNNNNNFDNNNNLYINDNYFNIKNDYNFNNNKYNINIEYNSTNGYYTSKDINPFLDMEKINKKSEIVPESNLKLSEFIKINQIGKGTEGTIYSVKWKRNNKIYALKRSAIKLLQNVEKRQEEIMMLKDFRKKTGSDGVIRIYGFLCVTKKNYYDFYEIMELAEIDWEKEIQNRSKFQYYYDENELMKIMGQIVRTFSLLQKNHITHRDIKPQNIMIVNGNYKICDFGNARILKREGFVIQNIRGSELYMSPLIFKAFHSNAHQVKHNTFKSDVFSLGMCFLLAAALSFRPLNTIREIYDMNIIKGIIQQYLGNLYSQKLIDIIISMIQIEEYLRPDFIQLEALFPQTYSFY